MGRTQPNLSDVERYYKDAQLFYDWFWSRNGMHYGIREQGVRFHDESIDYSTQLVAETLGIGPGHHVLDAGCGTGAVAEYLVRRYGARITGITISAMQAEVARRRKTKHPEIEELLAFEVRDFLDTGFPAEHFSAVFGIESVCYAHDKLDFLIEAYRVLEKGGRVAVTDGFLARDPKPGPEREAYRELLVGLAMPNLERTDRMLDHVTKAGFSSARFQDKTPYVDHSSLRIYRFSRVLAPTFSILRRLRIVPRTWPDGAAAGLAQRILYESGVIAYGIISGSKS